MPLLSVNNKIISAFNTMIEAVDYNVLGLPPFTIRVKYQADHEPDMPDVKKTLVDAVNNVWDVTYENTNWSTLFKYQIFLLEILGANIIGVTDLYYTFYECRQLSSVAMFDTSTVTSMYGTFYYCDKLTSIPLFNTANVTNMRGLFGMCSSMSAVPDINTSNVKYVQGMFSYCSSLTELPDIDTSKVTNMERMCRSCTSLTSIPELDTTSVSSIHDAFRNCPNVEYGALDLYNQLSTQLVDTSAVSGTFTGCGSATTTGSAELNQIPTSWGGNLDTSNIIGGRLYKTVKIGNQEWLAENLDYKLPELEIGTDAWSDRYPCANYYNNDENTYGETGNKCGLLYNWSCVYEYLIRNKNLVIPGWHVPSKSEWETLIAAIGGTSVAGKKLKSTTLWQNGGQGDGSTEFNALPAGMRNAPLGDFAYVGYNSFTKFWTSDTYEDYDIDEFVAWTVQLSEQDNITMDGWEKEYQFSVRLVKDS